MSDKVKDMDNEMLGLILSTISTESEVRRAMRDAYKHNLRVHLEKVADALEGLAKWH